MANTLFVNKTPTNQAWAELLLKNIGAPVTPNNVNNVMRWQAAENPPSNWANRNNPLNASLGTSASDGTGSYSDLTTAAKNTATMIVQGYKGGAIGGGIYTALMSDAPTDAFSIQVANSNWSGNHYGVASAGSEKAVPGRIASWFTTIPVPAPVAATNANPGSGIATPATVDSTAAKSVGVIGCESKKPVFKTGGVFGVGSLEITACNVKAWAGGLSIFFGGGLMLGGLFMLSSSFRNTAVGGKVQDAVGKIPGGVGTAARATVSAGKRTGSGLNNYRNATKAQRSEKFNNRPKTAVINKNPR